MNYFLLYFLKIDTKFKIFSKIRKQFKTNWKNIKSFNKYKKSNTKKQLEIIKRGLH